MNTNTNKYTQKQININTHININIKINIHKDINTHIDLEKLNPHID